MPRSALALPPGLPGKTSSYFEREIDQKTASQLRLLLVSGGDCRIQPDPVTRRNMYGTPIVPAPKEIWLSSSTASAISENGFLAAGSRLAELSGRAEWLMQLPDWFDRVRDELAAIYCPDNCDVVLTPSGTDAELITVSMASALMDGPICNILVGPGETGSGVKMAAGGSHFQTSASYAHAVPKGQRLAGLGFRDIDVKSVEIRDQTGRPRTPVEIDADVATLAAEALKRGSNVLLHVLDTSKTGLSGLTRKTAAEIQRRASGRVMVVVDACQLRCSAAVIRDDLDRGFMVQITGSKFAGGPAFCGALLLPEAVSAALADGAPLPDGLAAYSALLDWPEMLRSGPGSVLTETVNIGLALRWYAALADMTEFENVELSLRGQILSRFDEIVAEKLMDAPFLSMPGDDPPGISRRAGIVPLTVSDQDGQPASLAFAKSLNERLRKQDKFPAIHLGQPVELADRTVLRACASAQHVVMVADAMQDGSDLDSAFATVAEQMGVLSRKLFNIAK